MSARVSRSFPLPSPIKFEEGAAEMVMEKQGIVTILGSDFELNKVPPSLRRTISADMSSKKWLAQNGFSPMKRIASSGELAASAAGEGHHQEDEYGGYKDEQLNMPSQDDVWRSIQSQKENKNLEKPTPQLNAWSSILAEKTNDSNNLPPPYIHPLVKRSASTLSEKSLEICTESLGSETGSDGFSSYPPSETGDMEDDHHKEEAQQHQQEEKADPPTQQCFEELQVAKYNYNPSKKMAPRSFPPPLPSLARGDGRSPSLHMHSHRKNGRLVLQAVAVPQQNFFHAERQDGRLLLTLVNNPMSQEPSQEEMKDKVEEFAEVFDNFEEFEKNEVVVDKAGYGYEEEEDEEEEEEEEDEEEEEEEVEQNGVKEMAMAMEKSSSLPSGVINVHRSALMMRRLMGLDNKDPTWSNKLNKTVNLMEVEELTTPIPHSLPPAPRVARLIPSRPSAAVATATAGSFNLYEYFCRNKPTMESIINPVTQQCTPLKDNKVVLAKNNTVREAYEQQQDMVLMRGNKADYLVPLLKGCKESRRSLLIWQPYCIATS